MASTASGNLGIIPIKCVIMKFEIPKSASGLSEHDFKFQSHAPGSDYLKSLEMEDCSRCRRSRRASGGGG